MFTKTYEEFEKTASVDFTVHEKTYSSYVAEGLRTINRALRVSLADLETKTEHDATISSKEAFEKIKQYLVATASTKTSDSWRKCRRALAYYFRASGFTALSNEINETENTFPAKLRTRKPKKKKRMITVTQETYDQIFTDRKEVEDTVSITMLTLCKELGIRPSEALGVEIIDFDIHAKTMQIFVTGAKKTKRGEKDKSLQRGLDRTLTVPISKDLIDAVREAGSLTMSDIKLCQERIRRAGLKIWPGLKRRFCLYSLRYTMGSNLKAKYLKRPNGAQIVAAVMGHKCTSSMSEYGCIQSGSAKTGTPIPDADTIRKVVDDRAKKYGVKGKFDVRKVLPLSAIEKRDAQRQPSVKNIISRPTSKYGISEAKEISARKQSSKNGSSLTKD